MREYVVTVSSRGRVTLPVVVRRKLGIHPGEQVASILDDEDGVKFHKIERGIRSVRGVIPTPAGLVANDCDALIEEAMSDHADQVMRRM